MRAISTVLIEASIVGIVTIIFGTLITWVIRQFKLSNPLPQVCRDWNKNYIMEIVLFLTGFFVHLFFEYSPFGNLNKMYCNKAFKNKK